MGRPLRIGLASPYFGSVVGGGEVYLATAAGALRDAYPQHQVEITCPVPVDPADYGARLGVDLDGLAFHATNRRVTPVHHFLNSLAPLRPLRNHVLAGQARGASGRYDVLLVMVYAIPVASDCPRSLMLCQFPYREPVTLEGYREIVCQSRYVAGWVQRYWQRSAAVVTPPISIPAAEPDLSAKEDLVLSVGRFFAGGHSKRQDVMVEVFRRLCDGGLEGWELHLAGSVHGAADHRGYFEAIRERASGYPIFLHPDVPRPELNELYRRAALYWHAAGYGADPEGSPEALEHFGMATAEAMGAGAVPIVFGAGGQLEVVDDGVTGLVWTTPGELGEKTLELAGGGARRRAIARAARQAAGRFSPERFRRELVAQAAPLIEEAEAAAGPA